MKFKCLFEAMEIGKLNLYFLLILLFNLLEPILSLMDILIVLDVLLQLVEIVVKKICPIQKLIEMMYVDIRALKMVHGKTEYTQGSTETSKLSKL